MKYYQKDDSLLKIDSDRAIGIEVEVENITLNRHPHASVWIPKDDGSLRNNGREYITVPIPASGAPLALQDLLGNAFSKDCCFSPRTSIHVHVNMLDEVAATVEDSVLMYTLFEQAFYDFVGRGRIKNIYCVPLFDTSLLQQLAGGKVNAFYAAQGWSKYTGLNIAPLMNLGTIEFRQMHGTFEVEKLSRWIRIICSLVDWCRKQGTDFIRNFLLKESGTINSCVMLAQSIFGEDYHYMKFSSEGLQKGHDAIRQAFTTAGPGTELNKQVVAWANKGKALGEECPFLQFK